MACCRVGIPVNEEPFSKTTLSWPSPNLQQEMTRQVEPGYPACVGSRQWLASVPDVDHTTVWWKCENDLKEYQATLLIEFFIVHQQIPLCDLVFAICT